MYACLANSVSWFYVRENIKNASKLLIAKITFRQLKVTV